MMARPITMPVEAPAACTMRAPIRAPIDRRLIDTRMLTAKERNWIDSYHARVQEVLGPLLDAPTCAWLDAATRPLGNG